MRENILRIKENMKKVIIGKDEVMDKILTALLSGGHVLLEDLPGTGKTVLAKSLAKSMNGEFRRVQFTPDLLPSDVTGLHYFNQKEGEFQFREGPVFTQILLADEINRATPRTQSSLLECMEERQVTLGFTPAQAGSIGIIGGADGPTAIYLTSMLAPELLGPIAVAAYSYMALVPVIQPPIMRALTNKKERGIKMRTLRPVSKLERILFPLIIAVIISLLLPSAAPLIGCLMLGNLMKECGVVDRLSKTVQNELMNIVVIFLGLTVGATATAEAFLNFRTLGILVLGVVAFAMGTAGGLLLAKLMNVFSKDGNKINPLIGSAGVSAVPMAARVSQTEGQKENPSNYLLMHAMGPNVAGVVGSAVAAGILLSFLG